MGVNLRSPGALILTHVGNWGPLGKPNAEDPCPADRRLPRGRLAPALARAPPAVGPGPQWRRGSGRPAQASGETLDRPLSPSKGSHLSCNGETFFGFLGRCFQEKPCGSPRRERLGSGNPLGSQRLENEYGQEPIRRARLPNRDATKAHESA